VDRGHREPAGRVSRVLNKYNPVPLQRSTASVPIVITVPNDNTDYAAALGGTAVKPPEGWPVVIFYHGITRNRLDMFALTEPLNNAGYAVIAIDQPLHGIAAAEIDFETITPEELGAILAANPTALFRVPGVPERTFDLDLQNNATGAAGPDGNIDASGTHFINLANGLVSRDNLRQAAVDLVALTRSIPAIDIDGDELPDFDGSRVHFIGQSLGGIAGTTFLSVEDSIATATLGVAGGVVSDLLLDSFSFGPRIEAGLIGNGLVPNTSLYNNFIRDLQNIVDAGDPISHAARAAGNSAIHFIQVDGDAVVPNSASNRLAAEMAKSGLTDFEFSAAPIVDLAGHKARVCFTTGASHGSQLDPGSTAETRTATGEMQGQQVVFIAGNPAFMLPGNGQTLIFGASGSPQAAAAYGNFDEDCNAPNRTRANAVPN
jgi:pimeloyl-ACP methyl ester carboxylesterase